MKDLSHKTTGALRCSTATDAIIILDQRQRVLLLNPAAENLLGYRAKEIVGRPLNLNLRTAEGDHLPLSSGELAEVFEHSRQTGGRQPTLARRKDGALFPVETEVQRFADDRQSFFLITLRHPKPERETCQVGAVGRRQAWASMHPPDRSKGS